eukprot:c18602_g1_i1.p2 GENE.c18602_g1_i1~~c18602_g1_i1.p2  ORF type:complete len:146 (+),score=26.83 c18602_g1_i1:1076-1513(+)
MFWRDFDSLPGVSNLFEISAQLPILSGVGVAIEMDETLSYITGGGFAKNLLGLDAIRTTGSALRCSTRVLNVPQKPRAAPESDHTARQEYSDSKQSANPRCAVDQPECGLEDGSFLTTQSKPSADFLETLSRQFAELYERSTASA